MAKTTKNRFWETKKLSEMSQSEWESICDGCGKCCLIRMEDEDSKAVYVTNIRCKLMDARSCSCKYYNDRKQYVPDCVQLTPKNVKTLKWIPKTCSYRLLAEGKPLPDYHHLITGSRQSIHNAGMSVSGATICETSVKEKDHHKYITIWPGETDIFEDKK